MPNLLGGEGREYEKEKAGRGGCGAWEGYKQLTKPKTLLLVLRQEGKGKWQKWKNPLTQQRLVSNLSVEKTPVHQARHKAPLQEVALEGGTLTRTLTRTYHSAFFSFACR